jgi:hypothetical protein
MLLAPKLQIQSPPPATKSEATADMLLINILEQFKAMLQVHSKRLLFYFNIERNLFIQRSQKGKAHKRQFIRNTKQVTKAQIEGGVRHQNGSKHDQKLSFEKLDQQESECQNHQSNSEHEHKTKTTFQIKTSQCP